MLNPEPSDKRGGKESAQWGFLGGGLSILCPQLLLGASSGIPVFSPELVESLLGF